MRTAGEILAFALDRVEQISARPLMYGGTAEGTDLILHNFHEVISVIIGREDEVRAIVEDVLGSEGCGSANFATHFRRSRPDADEHETARHVVSRWAVIGERVAEHLPVGWVIHPPSELQIRGDGG